MKENKLKNKEKTFDRPSLSIKDNTISSIVYKNLYQKLLDYKGEDVMQNGIRLDSIDNLLNQNIISSDLKVK